MMDIFLIFLVLLVLLAVGTIVGHLLWRLVALMFGLRVQTVSRNVARPRPTAHSSDDIQSQLDRLVEFRLIDAATRERVLAATEVQRKIDATHSVLARSPISAPPPLPAIPVETPPSPLPLSMAVRPGVVAADKAFSDEAAASDPQ